MQLEGIVYFLNMQNNFVLYIAREEWEKNYCIMWL